MKKLEMNQIENLNGGTCLSAFLNAAAAWYAWAGAQTAANAFAAAGAFASQMYECGY
jgi:hypothetical protein